MSICSLCGKPEDKCDCTLQMCMCCGDEYKESQLGSMIRSTLEQSPICRVCMREDDYAYWEVENGRKRG